MDDHYFLSFYQGDAEYLSPDDIPILDREDYSDFSRPDSLFVSSMASSWSSPPSIRSSYHRRRPSSEFLPAFLRMNAPPSRDGPEMPPTPPPSVCSESDIYANHAEECPLYKVDTQLQDFAIAQQMQELTRGDTLTKAASVQIFTGAELIAPYTRTISSSMGSRHHTFAEEVETSVWEDDEDEEPEKKPKSRRSSVSSLKKAGCTLKKKISKIFRRN
ncbi:hypothetical protein RUND412_011168 [Rhizina undulata]